ncbi:MAG: hypothetical protein KDD06_16725, partial [Phaeodactylibacter sp.]|nr:hypothetical protein [Phaeodactylibacter sp.]
GGMREPAIARWPGTVEPGSVQVSQSSTLDLYATAMKLAGTALPDGRAIDGNDIGPMLRGEVGDRVASPPFFYYGPNELHAVR